MVEIPRLLWWLILHGIILRIRPARSARKYASIWTPEGSPLKVWTEKQALLLARLARRARPAGRSCATPCATASPSIAARARRAQAPRAPTASWCCRSIRSTRPRPPASVDRRGRRLDAARAATARVALRQRTTTTTRATSTRSPRSVSEHWQRNGRGRPAGDELPRHAASARCTLGDPYHCECLKTARLLAERLKLRDGPRGASPSSPASAAPSGCSPTPSRRCARSARPGVARRRRDLPRLRGRLPRDARGDRHGGARRLPRRRRQGVPLHPLPQRPARMDHGAGRRRGAPPAGLGHRRRSTPRRSKTQRRRAMAAGAAA